MLNNAKLSVETLRKKGKIVINFLQHLDWDTNLDLKEAEGTRKYALDTLMNNINRVYGEYLFRV